MGTTLTETERGQVSGRAAEKLGRFVSYAHVYIGS